MPDAATTPEPAAVALLRPAARRQIRAVPPQGAVMDGIDLGAHITALAGRSNRSRTAALAALARAVADVLHDPDAPVHRTGADLLAELEGPSCLAMLADRAGAHRGATISVGAVRDRGPELIRHYGLTGLPGARSRSFALLAAEFAVNDRLCGYAATLTSRRAPLDVDLHGAGALLGAWATSTRPEVARCVGAALAPPGETVPDRALPGLRVLMARLLEAAGEGPEHAESLALTATRALSLVAEQQAPRETIGPLVVARARALGLLPAPPRIGHVVEGGTAAGDVVRLLLLADLGLLPADGALLSAVADLADELSYGAED